MAQLKINDLSVGDWVQDKEGTPAKILGIEQWSGDYYLNVEVNGADVGNVIAEGALPIPITPEILEKNGFSHNGNKWYTPELFTLERWLDKWSIVIACACGDYVCEVCTIKYVHQLQRAMKLAGVEKEIEL